MFFIRAVTCAHYLSGRVGGWVAGWVAGWVGGQMALEEWKLRLASAKVEVEVEAELGKKLSPACYLYFIFFYTTPQI